MIVKMKKITLLVTEGGKHSMLEGLRKLGVVHIKNLKKPSFESVHNTEEALTSTKEAIDILCRYEKKKSVYKSKIAPDRLTEKAHEIASLYKEKEASLLDIEKIEASLEWFKPWGDFDPQEIELLAEKGVLVSLHRINRASLKELKQKEHITIVSEDKQYVYIMHATNNPVDKLPFKKLSLPEKSYSQLHQDMEQLEKRIGEIEGILHAHVDMLSPLKKHFLLLEKQQEFINTRESMACEKGFVYLQGYCPVDQTEQLEVLSKEHSAGYLIEEAKDFKDVPTFIRNPKWISIVAPVFKFMNTVPGYKEYDISLWFLLFFSLFFAMLIGDAGYGVLFFVTTFLVRRKFKKAPMQPFMLMYVLSFTTILWGVITGTWFGAEKIAQLPFLNSLVIDKIGSFTGDNQSLMIYICFTIGVIHLSIAHITLAARIINSLKALAEIGWILVLWGLYFLAGTLVLGRVFPGFAKYLLIGGVGLLILFSNPQKNILKGIALSLVDIPLKIIGSFADVVSYLRLFAVGYASVVLASTVNNMASDIGFNSIVASIVAAFILFFGHALNIILGFMAVIVHGIRLNMLEFSGQMGMEWSGKEYSPFKE